MDLNHNAIPKPNSNDTSNDQILFQNTHLDEVHIFNSHKRRQGEVADDDCAYDKLEELRVLHAKELTDIKRSHERHIHETKAECQRVLDSARMAHSGQLANKSLEIRQLLIRIQTLEETIESQQNELSNHAEADAQMRQVELRTHRLDYVDQFIDKFKSVTKKARLPPPVQSLITDIMSNELLEDLSTRFLTVGKVAFEMLHYELPIDRLAKVGIYASDKYLEVYAHRPPKYNRFVGGNPAIEVNYYTDTDRWIIEDAIKRERLDQMGVPAGGLG